MTRSGVKKEDYREVNDYWIKRLIEPTDEDVKVSDVKHYLLQGEKDHFKSDCFKLKQFTHNVMTLGYTKSGDTERILTYEHAGIEIREGNPEWGAEKGKLYFVIKHGKGYET